jgi:hypothetical protein
MSHAKLSASGSARWINCPGSVKAEEGFCDKSSTHATYGTDCHELAEICLKQNLSACSFVGKSPCENKNFVVDMETADYVQVYIDYVRSLGGCQSYERRVDYSEWVPDGFGTSDAIVHLGNTLYICDLKMGKGVKVDADNNSQGMLYALGAYAEMEGIYDVETVVVVIVQPRLDHISEWSISVSDLLKWAEWVSHRAAMTLEPNAERSPGEKQCQWCKAKAVCPALEAYTKRILMADFDSLESPDKLTDEQLREALDAKKLIVGWLEAVEQLVKERLESGESFTGFKLVAGRSLRQWGDEASAAEALEQLLGTDDAYERKLLTPSKAEKMLGKAKAKEIQSLIIKPEGKPTLAPENDKRPAVNVGVDDFDKLS